MSLVRSLAMLSLLMMGTPIVTAQPLPDPELDVAMKDPDFLVQGEYAGENRAMQVIAMGDGEFQLVVYEGGLPGAGWNRNEPRRLDGDADLVDELKESLQLKRVDRLSPTLGAGAPAGSIVLGTSSTESVERDWQGGKMSSNALLIPGTRTKKTFQDYVLHVEFRTPFMPHARGQARGNSGVYHQGRYETQILDSFGLKGVNNECGGIYEISDPSVNACLPPLAWQTYDIEFTAAKYDEGGQETSPAKISAKLNGIVVQSEVAVPRATRAAPLNAGPEPGPIYLQDHGNPVRFRNIWIVPRDAQRDARRPIVPGVERMFTSAGSVSAEGGELLIETLHCKACHSAADTTISTQPLGPSLNEISNRVRPNAMLAMIAHPHDVKPGTTMPDPWPGIADAQRLENAKAIVSFFLATRPGQLTERTVSQATADRGKELYHSIGCVACHASQHGDASPPATSVPLGPLAEKYTLTSLAKFLIAPHQVRASGRMPRLTSDPGEATQIAAYLLRDVVVKEPVGKFTRTLYRGNWESLPDFTKLKPESTSEVVGLKLDDIQPQFNYAVSFEAKIRLASAGRIAFRLSSDDGSRVLIDGQQIDNDGIHPATTKTERLRLKAGLHDLKVLYFQGGGEAVLELEVRDPDLGWQSITSLVEDPGAETVNSLVPNQFAVDVSLVAKGKELFTNTGCVQCHAWEGLTVMPALAAKPLYQLDSSKGCLADEVRSPAVDYQLTSGQAEAMRGILRSHKTSSTSEPADAEHVMLRMAAMNCYACHVRDELGGVEAGRDASFQTTTPEMGLEGRLPPSLTGVGDKLNDAYLAKVLREGANERPYMKTRMPAFGDDAMHSWHEAVVRMDRRDDRPTLDNADSEANVIGAGRACVGNSGLACIKCHRFDGETGGGIGAIDMLKMTDRLRPEWFYRYLLDPQTYRPGTRMPSSFVEGKSALTSIYDGDPARQIDAMWSYLSLGKDAKIPEGLIPGAIVLAANERPRIYRNFISGASPRAIAVGYPGGMNLVWDAARMTLVELWKNGFMDASRHWNNRGQGDQEPLGDSVVRLSDAPTVGRLDEVDAAWPSESLRDRGAKFRGYTLDTAGLPTFEYVADGDTIRDTPRVASEEGRTSLRRTIVVTPSPSDTPRSLVASMARGKITPLGNDAYRVDDQYTITAGGAVFKLINIAGQDELRATLPTDSRTELWQQINW